MHNLLAPFVSFKLDEYFSWSLRSCFVLIYIYACYILTLWVLPLLSAFLICIDLHLYFLPHSMFVLFVYCLFEWHSTIYKHPAPRGLYVTIGRKMNISCKIVNGVHITIQHTQGELTANTCLWTEASTWTVFRCIYIKAWHNHIITHIRLAQD